MNPTYVPPNTFEEFCAEQLQLLEEHNSNSQEYHDDCDLVETNDEIDYTPCASPEAGVPWPHE